MLIQWRAEPPIAARELVIRSLTNGIQPSNYTIHYFYALMTQIYDIFMKTGLPRNLKIEIHAYFTARCENPIEAINIQTKASMRAVSVVPEI